MLEIRGLYSGYGKEPVLKNVSLTAKAGEITVLLGPNGCGKSTLLKTVCGILPLHAGQILLDGTELTSLDARTLAQRISYLPQSRQLSDISVEQLVLHGRFPYLHYPRRYRQEDRAIARAAMETMELLPLAERLLCSLSGGERQRAYIAMALAQDTATVLLDEPTTYLDISAQLQLMVQVRQLAAMGKHVLMVMHDLPMALQWADHVALLQEGQLVAAAPPEALFESGAADRVFGIRLRRSLTEQGWQYYCTRT